MVKLHRYCPQCEYSISFINSLFTRTRAHLKCPKCKTVFIAKNWNNPIMLYAIIIGLLTDSLSQRLYGCEEK